MANLNWSILFRLLMLAALIAGHIGIWIALFNRINATGLHRKNIKAIEKSIVLVCLTLPFALIALEWVFDPELTKIDAWYHYFMAQGPMPKISSWSYAYGILAIGYGLTFGPLWLMQRPQFQTARHRFGVLDTHIDKHLHRSNPEWPLGRKAKRSLRIPGNELLHLEVNTKALWLDAIPEQLVGFRIGHLSDIHLTGDLPYEYYRHAMESLVAQQVDLICLSGDIIDRPEALPGLKRVFGDIAGEIPKLFVLGNHDRACELDQAVREVMAGLGWIDVGVADCRLAIAGRSLVVLGNERPWFRRELSPGFGLDNASEGEFRLGISHSPDQLPWAKKLGISLLLCGHTHGGQIRFPWVGPIIAPSKYGSRYASGVFHQSPTLMHVSRGLSGVHLIRLGCLPEVTVLELRKR